MRQFNFAKSLAATVSEACSLRVAVKTLSSKLTVLSRYALWYVSRLSECSPALGLMLPFAVLVVAHCRLECENMGIVMLMLTILDPS